MRSLLDAWPEAAVFGLDYSARSTGLNFPGFRGVFILPPLGAVDAQAAVTAILELTEEHDAWFLSGLDLESELLASMPPHPRLVVPSESALNMTAKQALGDLAEHLSMSVPASISIEDLPTASSLAETYGWRCWVKGRNYEAMPATNPWVLESANSSIRRTWGTPAFLQEHVDGREASYAIAAYEGILVGACRMDKSQLTDLGKTWAGNVRVCTPRETEMLTEFAKVTNWTGGAELELVEGRRLSRSYLIDVNPRFPAWIHGATIAGTNLPARLVATAAGCPPPREAAEAQRFTRVVVEVPERIFGPDSIALMGTALAECTKGHPSGMPMLSRSLHGDSDAPSPYDYQRVAKSWPTNGATPFRHFDPVQAQERCGAFRRLVDDASSSSGVAASAAYSVKTSNQTPMLRAAISAGFQLECISRAEVARAIDSGASAEHIVLNGPGKWWPEDPAPLTVGTVFADSVEDMHRINARLRGGGLRCSAIGMRIRPPGIPSRFGVELDRLSIFRRAASALMDASAEVPIGMHFHLAASSVGVDEWLDRFVAAVELFRGLTTVVGRAPVVVDIGGGWAAEMAEPTLMLVLEKAFGIVRSTFGTEVRVLVEPGKYLARSSSTLIVTVLEVTSNESYRRDVVADGAISDLPDSFSPTREVWWKDQSADGWVRLRNGEGNIFGRICMESDVLRRHVDIPDQLRAGDKLAFTNVGAYDESMSYEFGS